MKILVAIKRVIDYNVHIQVDEAGMGVKKDHVKMSMNPFDEIAVEEAVRLKEQSVAQELTAVTIGNASAQEILRQAMAMGCDKAIHVPCEEALEPLQVARILKEVATDFDLVLMGKQAIDDDCNQTGQMLAGLLGWAQATFASKIEISDGKAKVTREIDGGLETIVSSLPAVVTTDLRLNEPRYASLPNIMQARRKPIETVTLEQLKVSVERHTELLGVREPEPRKGGIMVENVDMLIDKLKNEAAVL